MIETCLFKIQEEKRQENLEIQRQGQRGRSPTDSFKVEALCK